MKPVEKLVASFDLVVLCLVDVAEQKGVEECFVAIFAYFVEGEFVASVAVVVVLVVEIWDW